MNIMDLAANFAADPRFRLAYQGPAGETAPAMRMQGGAQGYAEPAPPPAAIPVPGQSAQAVMPAGMSPEQRIGGGFEAAGQNQAPQIPPEILAAALQRAQAPNGPPSISGGASMPTSRPAFEPSQGAGWIDQLMSAAGPGNQSAGPLGRMLPSGIRNPLADAMMGLAGGDPTAPPLAAFAQGFAGAQGAQQSREDRKRAEQAATTDMAWKMEDRAYKREDRAYERGRDVVEDARDERKALREQRDAQMDEIAAGVGIRLKQAELTKLRREADQLGNAYDLKPEEMLRAESIVANRLDDGEGLSFPTPPSLTGDPGDPDDVEAQADYEKAKTQYFDAVRSIREDVYREISNARGSGADGAGGTSNVEVNGLRGEGTRDSPLIGSVEAVTQALDAALDAAPPGTKVYFLDENGIPRSDKR